MKKATAFIICLISSLMACTSTSPGRHALQKNPSVTISSQELRVRVRNLARPLAGIIQTASNAIIEDTNDPVVRRAALKAKTEAIPALFDALFQQDPGAALIDTSALVEQIKQDFSDGRTIKLNEKERKIVLLAAEDMKTRLQAVYLKTGASQQEIDDFWIQIEEWAKAHPLKGNFTVRDSTGDLFASSKSMGSGGLGAAITSAQDELADFAVRADLYADILPRQARWQAQLLIEEMMAERFVAQAVEQVGPIPLSLEALPLEFERERLALIEDIQRETRLVGQWIHAERIDSMDFVSSERQVILDALIEERTAILEGITQERLASIDALDSQRAAFARDLEAVVASALAQTRKGLIDHAFLRMAQLIAVVFPLVFIAGLILVWFAQKNRS